MYYLYYHKDLNGTIFYVGKGTKDTEHYKGYGRAYSKSGRSLKWKEIAKNGYTVEIIKEISDEEKALDEEFELMKATSTCINTIRRRVFVKYKVVKISDTVAFLYINLYQRKLYILMSNGDIYNNFGKKLKASDNGNGYLCFKVGIKETQDRYTNKTYYVHRLVAEAFVPNPENKKVVNHKDFDRSNNNDWNLEWTTQKENVQYSAKLGRYSNLKNMND